MQSKPIFKQGSEEYESETMRYNFETEKAYITKVVSKQGEGVILSDKTKRGIGLMDISERAKIFNGALEFDSIPGKGTKCKITIPLKNKNIT